MAGAVGNAPAVGPDERAGGGELVNPVVVDVNDVDVARAIGGDVCGVVELPGAGARDPGPCRCWCRSSKWLIPSKNAPAVVALMNAPAAENSSIRLVAGIGDVDVARGIGGDAACGEFG